MISGPTHLPTKKAIKKVNLEQVKGRLLFIGWIKVDGVTVYEAKPKDSAEPLPAQDGAAGDDSDDAQGQPEPEQRQSA